MASIPYRRTSGPKSTARIVAAPYRYIQWRRAGEIESGIPLERDAPTTATGVEPSARRRRGARRHRRRLPHRVAPRPGYSDPSARRLRARRGSPARRLRGRGGAMAARGRTREPARLAGVDRTLPRHRRHPPARDLRRLESQDRRAARDRDRRRHLLGGRLDRGRPAAAGLHLLPPGASSRRPRRADAARGVRSHHRGDRARVPGRRAHGRPAHRARQGEDPRRRHPLSGAVARRAGGPPGRGAARHLPGLQRGVLRDRRARR